MIRVVFGLLLCLIGGIASASTIRNVDLKLRVDVFGYSEVKIFSGQSGTPVLTFDFLDSRNVAAGFFPPADFMLNVGEVVSFSARLDSDKLQFDECGLASSSCKGGFGFVSDNRFGVFDPFIGYFGDDSSFEGGRKPGDSALLSVFTGAPYYARFQDLDFSWRAYVHQFTVVPVPLPESSLLLITGLGLIGMMRRREL